MEINYILQMIVSLLLIYYVIINIKLNKLVKRQKEENNSQRLRIYLEVYNNNNINPDSLDFSLAIADIRKFRKKALYLDSITPEYNKLVAEYPKLEKLYENNQNLLTESGKNYINIFALIAKELGIEFNKGKVIKTEDFTTKIKMLFLAISNLNKTIENLQANNKEDILIFNKKLHVKNQTIYRLRRKLGIKTNKKTGQNKNNK